MGKTETLKCFRQVTSGNGIFWKTERINIEIDVKEKS